MIPIKMLEERVPGRISILLPSRGRREMLGESISSLRRTAAQPWNLEFLIAYDPDDQLTRKVANAYDVDVVWEAPERYGYAGSARYYAALLEYCTGQWLLPTWGDDGIMLTDGWDDIVRDQPTPAVIYTTGGDKWGNNCYPIVSADVLMATGRFCDIPPVDSWYDEVGKLAGIHIVPSPPIKLMQDRFDLTGRNNDRTYIEGSRAYWARGMHPKEFYQPQWTRWRHEDAERVKALLAGRVAATTGIEESGHGD